MVVLGWRVSPLLVQNEQWPPLPQPREAGSLRQPHGYGSINFVAYSGWPPLPNLGEGGRIRIQAGWVSPKSPLAEQMGSGAHVTEWRDLPNGSRARCSTAGCWYQVDRVCFLFLDSDPVCYAASDSAAPLFFCAELILGRLLMLQVEVALTGPWQTPPRCSLGLPP